MLNAVEFARSGQIRDLDELFLDRNFYRSLVAMLNNGYNDYDLHHMGNENELFRLQMELEDEAGGESKPIAQGKMGVRPSDDTLKALGISLAIGSGVKNTNQLDIKETSSSDNRDLDSESEQQPPAKAVPGSQEEKGIMLVKTPL